jgi:hypothetical protein
MKKLLIVMTCLMFLFSPAYAKQKKKAAKESASEAEKAGLQKSSFKDLVDIKIVTPEEKDMINKYYRDSQAKDLKGKKGKKKKKLPPGLRKKLARGGELPPGWQKKVARGEVLDAEVYEHADQLPDELIEKLPKQPEDTVLIKVKGKIIRVLKATRTILDVFDLGF